MASSSGEEWSNMAVRMASVGDEGSNQGGGLHHGESTAGQESETPDLGTPLDNSSNTETTRVQETTAAAASKSVPTIHFVPASSGDTDHHRPSLFSPPAYCYAYSPPLPPQPGSLATNQIVSRMMAQMNYKEGTGLGKYGHGIIDPIQPTIKYRRGGIGKFEPPYDSDSDDDMGPPAPELGRGAGEAEPEAVDAEEVRAMDTLRRDREAYAAARARERRHDRVRAYNMRGQRPPKHDDDGEKITSGYTAIKRALKVVREQSESRKLTLGGLIHEFAGVKAKFPEEYMTLRMPYKAISFAAPLLHSQLYRQYNAGEFGSTEPLLNRTLVMVEALKDTLGVDASAAYPRLMNDLVMAPPLDAWRWSAEEPEPMLRFVNRWKDILPQATMDSILDEVILPELVATADKFRLSWSRKPNIWVGMWIPHLGHARLRRVYIVISRLLREWLCERGGISNYDYELALPWKEVFDSASWDKYIERHVVPRLRKALHDLKISVTMTWVDSNFFPLVMRWASIVPVKYMVPLLIHGFFKKWMHANYRYLMGERPRLDEAMAWYESWKGLFTPELLAEKRVVVQLEAGLDMINRATQGLKISVPQN